VILRNVFENPGWYTQYTPYQAEISQGRLESLLNFQTMVCDLTGLPLSNASLLDEATAAAEAMTMFLNVINKEHDHLARPKFFVDSAIFPQTKEVLRTRAIPVELSQKDICKAVIDETYLVPSSISERRRSARLRELFPGYEVGALVAMATDLLALCCNASGELGADVACGSAQRFGVPLDLADPCSVLAANEDFKRNMPGRIIGVYRRQGNRALRMALQTREQHIKREKATRILYGASALANMAAMYTVYHGPRPEIDCSPR
jgi:glycine dehydrogenase